MTITREAIAVPDSTRPTLTLLRELRRGRARSQAASAAYWIYLVALIVALLRRLADCRRVPCSAPSATAHRGDAARPARAPRPGWPRWRCWCSWCCCATRSGAARSPLPQVTVDWLLGTPVDRGRLLRPRFRVSAVVAVLAGVAVGIVPAAAWSALGLGGHSLGRRAAADRRRDARRRPCCSPSAPACAGLIERYPAGRRWLRQATPIVLAAAAAFAGLAAWAALGQPPAVLAAVVLWSGPWGWAAQATTCPGRAAPRRCGRWRPRCSAWRPWRRWPARYRAAAGVPGAALRVRARTIGAMSAAVLSMDTRGVANAFSGAASRRARLRLRPPRRRELVLLWRDLLALARTPSRLVAAAALVLLAVGLIASAGHGGQVSLVPVRLRARPRLPRRFLALRGRQAGRGGHPSLGEPAIPVRVPGLVACGGSVPGPAHGRRRAGRRARGGDRPPSVRRLAGRDRSGACHRRAGQCLPLAVPSGPVRRIPDPCREHRRDHGRPLVSPGGRCSRWRR